MRVTIVRVLVVTQSVKRLIPRRVKSGADGKAEHRDPLSVQELVVPEDVGS